MPPLAVVVLSVMLAATIGSLVNSIALDQFAAIAWEKPFVLVSSNGAPIPRSADSVMQRVRGICSIAPMASDNIGTPSIQGGSYRQVLGIPAHDIGSVLRCADWPLLKGRLPRAGHMEALVSPYIAQALHLHVGSRIGSEVGLGPLPGSERVVGIVDTSAAIVLMPYSALQQAQGISRGKPMSYIVAARGAPRSMVKRIRSNLGSMAAGLSLATYGSTYGDYRGALSNLFFLGMLVNVLMSVVLAVSLAFLVTLYLVQRLREYASMYILGWPWGKVARLFVGEVLLIAVVGWTLGMAAFGLLAHVLVPGLTKHGMVVSSSLGPMVPWSLPLPAALLLASGVVAWLRFSRLDAIQAVEGSL